MRKPHQIWLPIVLVCLATAAASGQGSFLVQCPNTTVTHPVAIPNPNAKIANLTEAAEPPYNGPTQTKCSVAGGCGSTAGTAAGYQVPTSNINGTVKCQQISGGDGYMTEADGNQTFMFSFGPLSGLGAIANGQPGTLFAADFNQPYTAGPNYNNGQPNPNYDGTDPLSNTPGANAAIKDPSAIMNTGVMNGNIPAPLIAFDEDDEFFLTLSNVGMIMRPDLFEQHTVHFHGYPNASSFYDGVPDASLAINIGGSFTYYYLAPDAGTYFWHCHITPPEHLQMGMVGQLYVRPRQNRVPSNMSLYAALQAQQGDLRTKCTAADILCSNELPPVNTGVMGQAISPITGQPYKYAYNDGDGSTKYDIDVPIQIHGFDPNFHFVGMTFNPEGFADMKDKYFLLNGRSYPDTTGVPGYLSFTPSNTASGPNTASLQVNPDPSGAISTASSDGFSRPSQPLPTLITLKGCTPAPCVGERALLRIADLDVTEYQTLGSIGIPMQMVGFNAKLLRDQAGNNLFVNTNSITLGGGESLDVILDASGVPPGTYFLYTTNLDHLSNDAENFGGLMTEVVVQ